MFDAVDHVQVSLLVKKDIRVFLDFGRGEIEEGEGRRRGDFVIWLCVSGRLLMLFHAVDYNKNYMIRRASTASSGTNSLPR